MNEPDIIIRNFNIKDYNSLIELWKSAELPYKPEGRDSRAKIESELNVGTTFTVSLIKID